MKALSSNKFEVEKLKAKQCFYQKQLKQSLERKKKEQTTSSNPRSDLTKVFEVTKGIKMISTYCCLIKNTCCKLFCYLKRTFMHQKKKSPIEWYSYNTLPGLVNVTCTKNVKVQISNLKHLHEKNSHFENRRFKNLMLATVTLPTTICWAINCVLVTGNIKHPNADDDSFFQAPSRHPTHRKWYGADNLAGSPLDSCQLRADAALN